MTLTTVSGYDRVRAVNIYAGYTGTNTITTRRAIRSALQAYSLQLGVGQTIFATQISNVAASVSNLTAVINNIPGVTAVTRVALDTPGNTALRLDADTTQLLTISNIILNNLSD
jgi:hypothetical protein